MLTGPFCCASEQGEELVEGQTGPIEDVVEGPGSDGAMSGNDDLGIGLGADEDDVASPLPVNLEPRAAEGAEESLV